MLEFQLFRISVYSLAQLSLFRIELDPSEVLRQTILSVPSSESQRRRIWHIGNVSTIDEDALYFRVGRTSKSTIELYDAGNFIDEEFETSPYTHVIADVRLELCAIAKKTKLSPTTDGIANQLVRLLRESGKAREFNVTFEISAINDPQDFIEHLRNAVAISKFWVTFSRPNAFDVDDDFHLPMQKLLKESDGRRGKTQLEGEQLRPDSLESISRSAAAVGDDAGAVLQMQPKERRVKKSLRGNPVTVNQDDVADDDQKRTFTERMRSVYERIRRA